MTEDKKSLEYLRDKAIKSELDTLDSCERYFISRFEKQMSDLDYFVRTAIDDMKKVRKNFISLKYFIRCLEDSLKNSAVVALERTSHNDTFSSFVIHITGGEYDGCCMRIGLSSDAEGAARLGSAYLNSTDAIFQIHQDLPFYEVSQEMIRAIKFFNVEQLKLNKKQDN